jgi:hypothetical protein
MPIMALPSINMPKLSNSEEIDLMLFHMSLHAWQHKVRSGWEEKGLSKVIF